MTIDSALNRLTAEVDLLWAAVTELAVIVLEDQPEPGGLAAADVLGEQVSELQGEIAALRKLLAGPQDDAIAVLPAVALHTQAAQATYWRQFRSHEGHAQIHGAVRRAGGHWPAWQRSVAATATRCETPLELTTRALLLCWQETIPLVVSTRERSENNQRPSIPFRRMS